MEETKAIPSLFKFRRLPHPDPGACRRCKGGGVEPWATWQCSRCKGSGNEHLRSEDDPHVLYTSDGSVAFRFGDLG